MVEKNRLSICYLSDAPTIHTQRWATTFSRKGYEVTVISFRPFNIEGVNVINVGGGKPLSSINYLLQVPNIRRLINDLRIDILHAHYCTSYGFIGAVSNKHPLIITAWGSDVLVSPKKSILYRILVKWVLSKADLVTSMANHMTKYMIQQRYVIPNKVITIPFGVDLDEFNPVHRGKTNNDNNFVVTSTRRLDKVCDIATFIKAVPIVLAKIPSVKFIIASDGPQRKELETLAYQLDISKQIKFTGWVPQNDLPRLLQTSDIVISTAISDGNNISLNEAMACGAFPVATDIPANNEWLIHRNNGLLFPPGNWVSLAENIIFALQNYILRQKAARINWEIVQQRASWQSNMKLMEDYYLDLI